jgi:hypothetical protein
MKERCSPKTAANLLPLLGELSAKALEHHSPKMEVAGSLWALSMGVVPPEDLMLTWGWVLTRLAHCSLVLFRHNSHL